MQSSLFNTEGPRQGAPSFTGAGSVQLLDLRFPTIVVPHLHGVQGPHSDQPPFTVRGNNEI